MKSFGFIPARADSKGIKRKNLVPLGGIPLIAHTIQSALASKLDRVFVSTDSEDTAQVARDYGVDMPFLRPKSLSGDSDSIEDAIIYTLNQLKAIDGYQPDVIVLLQPTSPFRTPEYINESLDIFKESGESVLSVSTPMEHPAEMVSWQNGKMSFLMEDILPGKQQRQDYPDYFFVNGMIYTFSYDQIMERKSRYSLNTQPLFTDNLLSIDIDVQSDLAIAESLLSSKLVLK